MPNKTSYAIVIGGANIDFVGLPDKPLIWNDKNPSKITASLGGVGRNIAENLAKLGTKTKLLSVVGDDIYGSYLLQETEKNGVDPSLIQSLKGQRSSVYFSIMDKNDDMAIALSDMGIIEQLTPELIDKQRHVIDEAELVILDTNLSTQTLDHILTSFPKTKFLVDTVSVSKAQKIQPLLKHINTLKPNRLEAELLTNQSIKSIEDAHRATQILTDKGINRVFLSLGSKGTVYRDNRVTQHIPANQIKVINAAGAGDAMMAGIAYGLINQLPLNELLPIANAAAALTLTAETTIHPALSIDAVYQFIEQSKG